MRSLDGNVTGSRLRLLSFPMWRRVLGLRVMLALPLIIWLKDGVLEWLDRVRLIEDLPAWLADARGLYRQGIAQTRDEHARSEMQAALENLGPDV